MDDKGADTFHWTHHLPEIMFAMNTEKSATTGDSAYNLVFGMIPRAQPGATSTLLDEIDDAEEDDSPPDETADDTATPRSTSWDQAPPVPIPRQQQLSQTSSDVNDNSADPDSQRYHGCADGPGPMPLSEQCPGKTLNDDTADDTVSQRPIPAPRRGNNRSTSWDQAPPVPIPRQQQPSQTFSDVNNNSADPDSQSDHVCIDGPGTMPVTEKYLDCEAESTTADAKRQSSRKRAYNNTVKSAAHISDFYNNSKRRKTVHFDVGDTVSVAIPVHDRAATDMRRLPGQVTKVTGSAVQMFTITTEFGVLQSKLRAGDLEHYTGVVAANSEVTVSLREAARAQNSNNAFIRKKCNCTASCTTNRCSCRSNSITCSTHCHQSKPCTNTTEPESNCPGLSAADARRLNGRGWLTDNHMTLGSNFLQKQFSHIGGLHDTVMQQRYLWSKPGGPNYVQIFNVNSNHWVVASNIFSGAADVIDIFDSGNVNYSTATLNVLTRFHRSPSSPVTVRVRDVQQQPNQYDCGPYALAFATALAHNRDPTSLFFTNPRAHLQRCFQECTMSPFPAQDRQSMRDYLRQISVEVYCVCRGIDDGTRMIACDSCGEWYHQACVLGRGVRPPKGEWQCNACSG